jgi:hypothetical protein
MQNEKETQDAVHLKRLRKETNAGIIVDGEIVCGHKLVASPCNDKLGILQHHM